jgi:hypothetical protein
MDAFRRFHRVGPGPVRGGENQKAAAADRAR